MSVDCMILAMNSPASSSASWKYGAVQPPYLKLLDLSYSGPPGACMTPSWQGTVKWFSAEKGYGYIEPIGGGPDVFVRYSAIYKIGFQTLYPGQRVEFYITQGPKGPQADQVYVF
jgi:cold shock protein